MRLFCLVPVLLLVCLSGKKYLVLMVSNPNSNDRFYNNLLITAIEFSHLVSEAFLNCYQCDNTWEDDDCWMEDSGNFGRTIECGPEYDACAKSYGGKH